MVPRLPALMEEPRLLCGNFEWTGLLVAHGLSVEALANDAGDKALPMIRRPAQRIVLSRTAHRLISLDIASNVARQCA